MQASGAPLLHPWQTMSFSQRQCHTERGLSLLVFLQNYECEMYSIQLYIFRFLDSQKVFMHIQMEGLRKQFAAVLDKEFYSSLQIPSTLLF